MVWSDMSPYLRREEQQGDRRAQTAGNTHTCIQQSQALGTCELQESLQGVGWHRCFWHSSSAWLPCALHRAGPCVRKFSVRFRLGGFRICLRQTSVCPTAPVPCWLASQLWLLQGGGLQCSGRAGWHSMRLPAVLPGFSHTAAAPWLSCCFISSQRLHALLRRGQTL